MAKSQIKISQDGSDGSTVNPADVKPSTQVDPGASSAPVDEIDQAAALVGIARDEVFAHRLYDDRIVVVTIAGRKLEALL